jgi:hypothetical protein
MPPRLLALLALLLAGAGIAAAAWRPVAPADLSRLKPAAFRDDELDLPYYLAHFHRLANAVVEEGPDRGFIRLPVWRAEKDNQPHNARIMENILSLAWFYTAKREWNPYYGAPEVRERLEAALEFWLRIQAPTGAFSEYGPNRWNLAATAFATKFMGRTLPLLHGGPAVDLGLIERTAQAQRRAIHFVLTDGRIWEQGRNFSNQFTNVWPGGLAWLRLREDAEIRTLLERRIAGGGEAFQSPAGYFYEAGGPDWSYNFGTHHSNLLGGWYYARGGPLERHFIEEERRFFDWVSYNAVPDGEEWVLNRAIETRQHVATVRFSYRFPLAEHVAPARPFVPSRESFEAARKARRQELEQAWPRVPPLAVGEFTAFAPYAFLHRDEPQWLPTESQKAAARRRLPYLARRRFVHQRMDTRSPAVFTYVRRPAYYAAWNSGQRITAQQRLGLGLVWTEKDGVVLQSQSRSEDAAWGTVAEGGRLPYEATGLPAEFSGATPRPGVRDLPSTGDFTVRYPLGGAGSKTVTFAEREIRVSLDHAAPYTEQIPILAATPPVEESPGRWRIAPGVSVEAGSAELRTHSLEVAGKRLHTLRVRGQGRGGYAIRFR